MLILNNAFDIGEPVYIKTDPDQEMGIIASIHVYPQTLLSYEVKFLNESFYCFEFELSNK